MGTNCAPFIADLFLFCYERDFVSNLKALQEFFYANAATIFFKPSVAKIVARNYWLRLRDALIQMFSFCKLAKTIMLLHVKKDVIFGRIM